MEPPAVVEGFEIVEELCASLLMRTENAAVEENLSFDGGEATLGEGVVITISVSEDVSFDPLRLSQVIDP